MIPVDFTTVKMFDKFPHQLKLENDLLTMKNRKLINALIIASLVMLTVTIVSINKTRNIIKNGKKDNTTDIS
jgi:hypothetical protein